MKHVFQKASEKVSSIWQLFGDFQFDNQWACAGVWYRDYPDCLSSVSLNIWKAYQHRHMIASLLNKLSGALTHKLKMDLQFLAAGLEHPCFWIISSCLFSLRKHRVFQSFFVGMNFWNFSNLKRLHTTRINHGQEAKYQSFWNFYSLFKRQDFGVSEIIGLHPLTEVGQIFQDQVAHLELVGSSIPMLRDVLEFFAQKVG